MADNQDYHGHPNYTMVLITLLVLMGLSIVVDMALPDSRVLALVLIFGLASAKAFLVMQNFMHLKYEPKIVDLFPYLSIACILIFFFGVAPDTIAVPLALS